MRPIRSVIVPAVVATLLTGTLAACGSNDSDNSRSAVEPAATPTARTSVTGDATLLVAEAWIVAVPDPARQRSTQLYAQIVNNGAAPVTITSVTTSASDRAEFSGVSPETGVSAGALRLNAGVVRVLRPGGPHIVVDHLERAVPEGSQVTVTLTTSDGRKATFGAPAKTASGQPTG